MGYLRKSTTPRGHPPTSIGGFWLLKGELELREVGRRALREDMYSMYIDSEAEHGMAFLGMEVRGGGAQGIGAESSKKVAEQLGEAKSGSEGLCALLWGSRQTLVCTCLFPGPHTPPVGLPSSKTSLV